MRFVVVFLLMASIGFADNRLNFVLNFPVEQTIRIHVDMNQTLPGFKMNATSSEELVSTLKIQSEQPIDLILIFKNLSVDTKINDKSVSYRSQEPAQSVESAQIAKAIDRPIRLQFDEHFQLVEPNTDLDKIVHDLPELGKLKVEKIVREMFAYTFALSKRKMKPGKVIEVPLGNVFISGLPVTLAYTITKVENDVVYATINGTIDAVDQPLENKLIISEGNEELVYLNAKGKIVGQGQWNMNNALIHNITTDFDINGSIKVNNLEWPLGLKGQITVKSVPIK